jgi:hypothetical protein
MSPSEFMRQLMRHARTPSAADVVAFYDRFGTAPLLARLTHTQRLRLAEIMHWADTVVELAGATPPGREPEAQPATSSTVPQWQT